MVTDVYPAVPLHRLKGERSRTPESVSRPEAVTANPVITRYHGFRIAAIPKKGGLTAD